MITINPNEEHALQFEMNIEGSVKNINEVFISMDSGRGYEIKIPASFKDGKVDCTLPVPGGLS